MLTDVINEELAAFLGNLAIDFDSHNVDTKWSMFVAKINE